MFSRIFCFFLISCIYSQINCAPRKKRDEDSDFTFSSDKVESMNDENHREEDSEDAAEDAMGSFYEINPEKVAIITKIVRHILKYTIQEQVGLVADKVQHNALNFVNETENIANKLYESGMNSVKSTRESVRNALDKSIQSTGEFFDAGIKTTKDNLEGLLTIIKTPFQQRQHFLDGLFG